ncbi:MAG: nickel-dependent lactate racemase [Acidobacteria bacterium]|nr:nickel-dependent lactate racemase [Acidobacteriota bacterium]
MPTIDLQYGRETISLEIPDRFDVITAAGEAKPLSDHQIGELLEVPINTKRIEEIVAPCESVLFVVPDATRAAGAGQIINLLVRRLIANGTMPFDIAAIFATGIHRAVTEQEKAEILTPFIAQRVKTLDHSPRDLMQIVNVGELSDGTPVELNRALKDFDRVITIGSVGFHYFAGFTGGRKLICPGLASNRTINATHRLAFDFERRTRAEGVAPGSMKGNPVHEAFVEAASKVSVDLAVHTMVNSQGEVTYLVCGDLFDSHAAACESFAAAHTRKIDEQYETVIVSCGGAPYDINLIQAHKALEAASRACKPGGRIYLIAECGDGLGRSDLLKWFDSPDSKELADRLAESYQVNGQTAWSLRTIAERLDVRMVTGLAGDDLARMGIKKLRPEKLVQEVAELKNGCLIRDGSRIYVRPRDQE